MLKVLKKDLEHLLRYEPNKLTERDFENIFTSYSVPTALIETLISYIEERFKDKYSWSGSYSVHSIFSDIAKYQYLPIDFCIKYKEKLGSSLFYNKNISFDDIIKIIEVTNNDSGDKWDFYLLSERNDIPMNIASKYKDKLDWFNLLKHNKYPENFLREHIKYIKWESLCSYYKLSNEFINDFKNLIDWEFIVIHQCLSEQMLRENAYRFDSRKWSYISKYQKLSEQFILEFMDKLDMNLVTQFQDLSEEFIDNNRDKLKLVNLHLNPHISKIYILKIQSEFKLKNKEKMFSKISNS